MSEIEQLLDWLQRKTYQLTNKDSIKAYQTVINKIESMNFDDFKINMLKLHPTEAIVVSFATNKICFDECESIYEKVKSKFPNNVVIALPDSVSLESCSKDVLENIISMIQEVIDEKL